MADLPLSTLQAGSQREDVDSWIPYGVFSGMIFAAVTLASWPAPLSWWSGLDEHCRTAEPEGVAGGAGSFEYICAIGWSNFSVAREVVFGVAGTRGARRPLRRLADGYAHARPFGVGLGSVFGPLVARGRLRTRKRTRWP